MLKRAAFLSSVLVALALLSAPGSAQSYPTALIQCHAASPEAEAALRSLPQVDILDELPRIYLEALVHPADLPLLRALGVAFTVVHADIEAFYASRLTPPGPLDLDLGSMGGYLTLAEIEAKLDSWRARYPGLITARQSLGKTHENRDLWVVKISANADVDEDEPEILIESLIHAREPSGMMSMMRCAEYLLERYGQDPVVTDLLDNREIWYVPVFNPDGYERNRSTNPSGGGMWRKNMYRSGTTLYGVDLNRNWGYQWGYDNSGSSPTPSSTTYRGTGPFSEPETRHVSNFLTARAAKGMTSAWDIHTYGGLLMWPYGYANVLSPRQAVYQELGADMVAENRYTAGPVYSTIYPCNGGSVDWYEGAAGLWGFTPEIGHNSDGFWPPTARILALAEENLHMLLTGIQYAGPYLVVKSTTLTEVGNNNSAFDPGEKIEVTCVVRNRGVATATAAKVRLESTSAFVVMEVATADLGTIPTATDASHAGTPLRARLLEATPPGTDLRLHLVLEFNGHRLRTPLGVFCGAGKTLVEDTCETGGW
ncbi:MAG: zinc carboxypeptidase, partial [Planctomycetes bacterium]|nr:zinc carboxypeptidase [Planctomycetota bacterium]